ncbi:macro domain-containing protein [Schleiferilactobacillus shenzhenensis]|uniref:O-acetyl-ADP-ribose deacetylase n=1 Tax=Schleiferilactobacillus shenzhenensis LY-73 TaxID=1231336 RepID=U4TVH3_9LACO|nr:macro domain-containing protein [Schleiferilactobacillus shenzhenensis]ERL65833.1 O-acetyl-ADP-ribose deacetylase [Schleiferilactobacillus shenzhenensis LY-73]
MNYHEEVQDLFDAPAAYVLAHCIAADVGMGAGIALTFRRKYPEMPGAVLDAEPAIGDAVRYTAPDGRVIYNLITKGSSYQKPLRSDFEASLRTLKKEMLAQHETHLAIPLIGAGLDRLDWRESAPFIQELFADTDVDIMVCRLK